MRNKSRQHWLIGHRQMPALEYLRAKSLPLLNSPVRASLPITRLLVHIRSPPGEVVRRTRVEDGEEDKYPSDRY